MSTDVQTILKLTVPVIVQVGDRMMPMSDILALRPGVILELEKRSEAALVLMVNNKPIGEGKAVKVGENFGIQVTGIGTATERVAAIGS